MILLVLLPTGATAQRKTVHPHVYRPEIPQANRFQPNKVFLERADSMMSGPNGAVESSYIVLKGNIEFTRGDMHLYCDSAHYYDRANSIDAYGNVRMERADHLSGRSDNLHYDGNREVVNLVGNVSITKDDKTLTSSAIDYYVTTNTGKYSTGGRLEDPKNVLTSIVGTYNFNTDQAVFTQDVQLVNSRDNYVMNTHRMNYNTRNNVATLVTHTVITSKDNKIVTNSGNYNTVSEEATLYKKNGRQPKLFAKDNRTLEGDKIHYSRHKSEGTAEGNVRVNDPKHNVILTGGYGYHNEHTHVSYATRQALARVYSKENKRKNVKPDTLFFHGDTITTFYEQKDTKRVLTATNGARFFRTDIQGLCGYLKFSEKDSILHLYNHPVVWSDARQISSDNEIDVHMKDSTTVDWALMPNKGLIVEHLGEIYYNQLSGKKIKAFFEKITEYNDDGSDSTYTQLRRAEVIGNVKALFFPQENDSTYNKCIKSESGYLTIDMKERQQVEKIKMWPEVSGKVIPLYLAKNSDLLLDDYQWFDNLRPKAPYDVMTISPEMRAMISQPYVIEDSVSITEPEKKSGRKKAVAVEAQATRDTQGTAATQAKVDKGVGRKKAIMKNTGGDKK